VIKVFVSDDTERLFRRERVKKFEAVERQVQRKLAMDAAKDLHDLSAAPGNRFERLRGTGLCHDKATRGD
jgi:plasmid maintenance system killer protein